MKFFGKIHWGDPEIPNMAVPVGALCFYCREAFDSDDLGVAIGVIKKVEPRPGQGEADGFMVADEEPYHRECFLRSILGSVAHQKQACNCYRNPEDTAVPEDDPSLTKRQSAVLAVQMFERRARA